jgi:DNA-3-methyladenine glycosylase II
MAHMFIPLPKEFDFKLNLEFLERSPRELLHKVEGEKVFKLLKVLDEKVLFTVRIAGERLRIDFLNGAPAAEAKEFIRNYVVEWFDLETDLTPFYTRMEKDKLLGPLIRKYYGYRIIGQPDLFESVTWAILGQQINLQFAYTLKQRFVEKFGERLHWQNQSYYLFPEPELVSGLSDEILLSLQFSRQKSLYVRNVAEAFRSDALSKQKLVGLPLDVAKEKLMAVKGVGNWTANYALMKTFRYPDAFPLEDAGVHNAIRNLKGLESKPSLDEVRKIFRRYKGWEAYATLYLWKSL